MDAVIYIIQQTKDGKIVAVTASIKEAKNLLQPGLRAELWVEGQRKAVYYSRTRDKMGDAAHRAPIDFDALLVIEKARAHLTKQQYNTLKGQVLAGHPEAALKGLHKIKSKGAKRNDNKTR